MSATHLHLLLNHLPILGVPFGIALLLLGVYKNSRDVKQAALGVFIAGALFAVPVFFTGEPAEHTVENLPGVQESLIERHEDLAKLSMVSLGALAIASLVVVVGWRNKDYPTNALSGVLVLSMVTAGSLALTGAVGGTIRHSEIRGSASVQQSPEETSSRPLLIKEYQL